MALYLLNTTVVPSNCDGYWEVRTISQSELDHLISELDHIINSNQFISAVGHESTASIMSTILGREVPVNRISVAPNEGDQLLCFKLNQRAPEGVILSKEQIEELGYHWVLMTYHGIGWLSR